VTYLEGIQSGLGTLMALAFLAFALGAGIGVGLGLFGRERKPRPRRQADHVECYDCGQTCLKQDQPEDATVPLCESCWLRIRDGGREATRCVHAFRDQKCGYNGSAVYCDKTLAGCRSLGNVERFVGFPIRPGDTK